MVRLLSREKAGALPLSLKDFGMEWKAAARALKEDNAFFVGTAMASPWEGGQAGRLLEAVCAERSKGERRVLVFRHGAEGFFKDGMASKSSV